MLVFLEKNRLVLCPENPVFLSVFTENKRIILSFFTVFMRRIM